MSLLESLPPQEILSLVNELGQRGAARQLGVPRTTLQEAFYRAREVATANEIIANPDIEEAPASGVRRFIFTAAQDNTPHHRGFLANLKAYAEFMDAELLISGFTYNKSLFEDHSKESGVYDAALQPYLTNRRMEIAGKFAFCAEMNTLPTAVNPLSGLETYSGSKSAIFPHAKVQLQSVPTMKNDPAKLMMTTGACTHPNYVPKKAGLKAEFHHIIGAVILEVTPEGKCFPRHLIAEDDGSFQDLTFYVAKGTVMKGPDAEAINWGDIHVEKLDPLVARGGLGLPVKTNERGLKWLDHDHSFDPRGSMLETLRPKYQFIHDVADFSARNHHNIRDPYHIYRTYIEGEDDVFTDMIKVREFLQATARPWCWTIVVESNHDLALQKWLKTADYKSDPQNALFFLRCQTAMYQAMSQMEHRFSIFEHVIRLGHDFMDGKSSRFPDTVKFLREDDSYTICGDIECAMHGHLGANGARPSPRQFTKMGPKANFGHTHSPSIIDGIYTAGVSGTLDMDYNKGLSSWMQAHIVTYANGKRTIVIQDGEDWCAPAPALVRTVQ